MLLLAVLIANKDERDTKVHRYVYIVRYKMIVFNFFYFLFSLKRLK